MEQPASYLSIEECMDEEMFYMAPSGSDTEEPTGDTDSDDMFLSAHDELSPLAADPETPTASTALGECGAEPIPAGSQKSLNASWGFFVPFRAKARAPNSEVLPAGRGLFITKK